MSRTSVWQHLRYRGLDKWGVLGWRGFQGMRQDLILCGKNSCRDFYLILGTVLSHHTDCAYEWELLPGYYLSNFMETQSGFCICTEKVIAQPRSHSCVPKDSLPFVCFEVIKKGKQQYLWVCNQITRRCHILSIKIYIYIYWKGILRMNQENYQEQRKIPNDNFTQLTCVKDHYYLKKNLFTYIRGHRIIHVPKFCLQWHWLPEKRAVQGSLVDKSWADAP